MQPLQNYIGPAIRIGSEILCLPYAGFFLHLKWYGRIKLGGELETANDILF